MKKLNNISLKKTDKVSKDLEGSYGKSIVIMTSNPEELDILYDKLKDSYSIIMDTEILDNHDYAKVIIRRT